MSSMKDRGVRVLGSGLWSLWRRPWHQGVGREEADNPLRFTLSMMSSTSILYKAGDGCFNNKSLGPWAHILDCSKSTLKRMFLLLTLKSVQSYSLRHQTSIPVSLLLILNRFQTSFVCFDSWLEISINKAFFDPLIVSPTKWSNTLKQFG